MEGRFCDVVFLVGDESVFGHRWVLAPLSPLIQHTDPQGPMMTLNFTGIIKNHMALKYVIPWFYNRDVKSKITHDNIEDIVTTCCLLGVNEICILCVEFLVEKLSLRTIFQTWYAAIQLGLKSLGNLCGWIARERFQDTLMKTNEALSITEDEMKIFYENSLQKSCPSNKWNEFIMKWCDYDSSRVALKDELIISTEQEVTGAEGPVEKITGEPSEEIFVVEDSEKREHFIYRPTTDTWVRVAPPDTKLFRITTIGIRSGNNTRLILAELREQEYVLVDTLSGNISRVNTFPLMPLVGPVTGLQIFFTVQNTLYAITDKRGKTMKYMLVLWEYMTRSQSWNMVGKILERFGDPCAAIEYIPRDDFGGFIITHTVPSDMKIHRLDVSKKPILQRKTAPRNVFMQQLSFPGIDPAVLTLDIIGTPDKLYIQNPTMTTRMTFWVYDVNEDKWYPEIKIDTIPSDEKDPLKGTGMYSSSSGLVYINSTDQEEEVFPTFYSFNPFTREKKPNKSMPHISKTAAIKMEVQRAPTKLLDLLPEATLKDELDAPMLDKWQRIRMINKGRERYGFAAVPEEPGEPPRPRSHVITPEMIQAYRQVQFNLRT